MREAGASSAHGEPTAAEPETWEPLPLIPKHSLLRSVRSYFLDEEPTLLTSLLPTCLLSMALYTRHPATNFIFDEQEALLANAYVRAGAERAPKIGWLQAFHRDFWGLTPDRTIGSYRPLPDLIWRFLWKIGAREQGAFPHAYVNVLIHGLNGALLVLLVARWTRNRLAAWLAGLLFVATAVVTEAVSGVVGLADVLGGTGVLLVLLSLTLPLATMPIAIIGAALLGLYSKESALCIVPLAPIAALLTSRLTHPGRPRAWARALVACIATTSAFVFYVETRRRWFPVTTPSELTAAVNAHASLLHRAFTAGLRWYAQPNLPHDPLNNPLLDATTPYRIAGALRVYARGLGQLLLPRVLSGDYSAPQEPIPGRLVFSESVIGAIGMVLPLFASLVLALLSWRQAHHDGNGPKVALRTLAPDLRDVAPVVAFALAWIVISYFPVSNIPVVLPTVRAERFLYFPAIGWAILLSVLFARWLRAPRPLRIVGKAVLGLAFAFQCFAARRHAFDYRDDLTFWNATRKAVPRSAKAHLNYSVMVGARGDLPARLQSNATALSLAPQWPMASVYMGDTLCRMHRPGDALPHYIRGFFLGPSEMNLIALGLQCLWDEQSLGEDSPARAELQELADRFPGSWLKYLVDDTLTNGDEYHGVDPKYRPRGYNEGPKKEK